MERVASAYQDEYLWEKATLFFFLLFNLVLGSSLLYRSFAAWYQIKLLLLLSFIRGKKKDITSYSFHSRYSVSRTVRANGQSFRPKLLLLEEVLEKPLATSRLVSAIEADV